VIDQQGYAAIYPVYARGQGNWPLGAKGATLGVEYRQQFG
jgi:hypothetical protein